MMHNGHLVNHFNCRVEYLARLKISVVSEGCRGWELNISRWEHSLHKNVTLKLLEYCFLHTFPDALESSFETLLKLLLGLLEIK